MKTVNKSVLIWYSASEMFALVTDIAAYPQFLPWCDQAAVLANDEHGMKNVGGTTASYHVIRIVTAATPKPPAKK